MSFNELQAIEAGDLGKMISTEGIEANPDYKPDVKFRAACTENLKDYE